MIIITGSHTGNPGDKGKAEVHHPIGKGPAPVTATTTAGPATKGTTEMREDLTQGTVNTMVVAPLPDKLWVSASCSCEGDQKSNLSSGEIRGLNSFRKWVREGGNCGIYLPIIVRLAIMSFHSKLT